MSIQACDDYSRPAGVMGGPCINCGRSQPEHAHRKPLPCEPRVQLTDGSPVPADRSHTKIDPKTGMQRGYIVMTPEERAKGFTKPVRRSYLHAKCGTITTMGIALAETYARNNRFYSGTMCVTCHAHFPLNEFTWEPDGEPMDPELQEAWNVAHTARLARENEERRQRRISDLRRELAELEAQDGVGR